MSSKAAIALEMLFITVGLYAAFFGWGILQEKIVTVPYLVNGVEQTFNYGLFVTFCQFIVASAVGLVCFTLQALFSKPDPSHKVDRRHFVSVPIGTMLKIGIAYTLASPFGYAAMKHVSFPVVLTLKMCKMIPIAVVGFIVYRRVYAWKKYAAMILITSGVMGFSLLKDAPSKGHHAAPNSHDDATAAQFLYGAVLCFINLFLDGYTSSSQEEVTKKRHASSYQMMLMTNVACAVVAIALLVALELLPKALTAPLSEIFEPCLFKAFDFIIAQPQIMWDLLAMSCMGAVGQVFLFAGMERFGSLTTTALTISRKMLSVIISIVWHHHQVSTLQCSALVLVMVGISLDTYLSVHERKKSHDEKKHH